MGGQINIFYEDIDFELAHREDLERWIIETASNEGFEVDEITYVFCSDEHLLGINQQFLDHDTFTDIITFPYNEGTTINGDIFISIERVFENAANFGTSREEELHRVMIHGILHLVGYVDGTDEDKAFMRKKEDHYLARLTLSN